MQEPNMLEGDVFFSLKRQDWCTRSVTAALSSPFENKHSKKNVGQAQFIDSQFNNQ